MRRSARRSSLLEKGDVAARSVRDGRRAAGRSACCGRRKSPRFTGMRPTILTAVTITVVAAVFACADRTLDTMPARSPNPASDTSANIRQLTFGGENAEAYFSHDGKRLIFQSHARRPYVRPAVRHERRRQRGAARVQRHAARRRAATSSTATAGSSSARRTRADTACPPTARSVEGLRLGSRPVRHLHRERRRLGSQAADELRRLHGRRARSRPTARRSSSRRSRTATSRSTR